MDLNKINAKCNDPLTYANTNKRYCKGDISKKYQKTKYKPFKIPPPPKLDEKKMFIGMKQ